jgi:4-amino-4-deoxyprephenate dehydrogenase
VATPPHLTLLALLARIGSGASETYWDVQNGNPHARRARTALAAALGTLADVADHGTGPDFAALLARAHRTLGPDAGDYARTCQELFVIARPPAPETVARRAVG